MIQGPTTETYISDSSWIGSQKMYESSFHFEFRHKIWHFHNSCQFLRGFFAYYFSMIIKYEWRIYNDSNFAETSSHISASPTMVNINLSLQPDTSK